MAQEKDKPDAGLRSLDHYKVKLPRWRYLLREKFLPIVRWETPYVAWLQDTLRTPALDSYFSLTANLGTHTFFMIYLPILFWCGYTRAGRAQVQILAMGVFFTGFVKDLLCLPRPLSPPLHRITMSGSAALEYGFPSTHSTNAVSVAVYWILLLREGDTSSRINLALQAFAYFYACSIVLGRLYCGMHGFFDVIVGTLLGILIGLIQYIYGDAFDSWILRGDFQRVILVELIILVLVRIHPEPADDCPCFDDSVAFSGVVMGIQFGGWQFAKTPFALSKPTPGTVPFSLDRMGWPIAIARTMLGVVIIFAWRGIMKPALLKILPPIFRVIEHYGLTLPRRFFMPASQYKTVPKQKDDDNVIPSARDIPNMFASLKQRRRAISVGPQSEADAYEALAYREKRRRDSINANVSPINQSPVLRPQKSFPSKSTANGIIEGNRKRSSSLEQFKAQMGMNAESVSPVAVATPEPGRDCNPPDESNIDELQGRDLFANLQIPRVRYDVEVVTKLIVYCGIAWWAVEGNPLVFEAIGLGLK
jgi:dihydrosphingosine 1-phosphate phosphatase